MKIYLATWLEDNQGKTLTEEGNTQRLMSFYFLKEAPVDFLDKYVQTGTGTDGKVWNGKIQKEKKKNGKEEEGRRKRTDR